jgi:hypothetical protein
VLSRVIECCTDRLFDIIHILRPLRSQCPPLRSPTARGPGAHRDIVTLTEAETDANAVGVRLLTCTGGSGRQKAAESVLSKVTLVCS